MRSAQGLSTALLGWLLCSTPACGDADVATDAAPAAPIFPEDEGPTRPERLFYEHPVPGDPRVPELDQQLTPCGSDAECGAGRTCFHITDDGGLCDTAQPVEASACAPVSAGPPMTEDECGCDGNSCDDDHVCRLLELVCSCGPHPYNKCIERACAAARDCTGDTVCIPSSLIVAQRCIEPSCTKDADCTDGAAGRCAMLVNLPQQAGSSSLAAVRCVYRGSPPDCHGTSAREVFAQNARGEFLPNAYACYERPH